MQCGQGKPFTMTSTNSKMGGAAVKSYKKGGMVVGQNPNIGNDTRDRAESEVRRRPIIEALQQAAGRAQGAVVKNTAPTRNKVVTKEQLQASGLNLRDYMNRQQGLTRRGSPAPTRIELDEAEAYTKRLARSGRPDQLSGELARNARSGDPTTGEAQDSEAQAAADAIGDEEDSRTRELLYPRRPTRVTRDMVR